MAYVVLVAEGLAFLWFVTMMIFIYQQHKESQNLQKARTDDFGQAVQRSARFAIPFGYVVVFAFSLYQVSQFL